MSNLMKKIGEDSHFEVVKDDRIMEYGNRIIQIDSDAQYMKDDHCFYLCEVANIRATEKSEDQKVDVQDSTQNSLTNPFAGKYKWERED